MSDDEFIRLALMDSLCTGPILELIETKRHFGEWFNGRLDYELTVRSDKFLALENS